MKSPRGTLHCRQNALAILVRTGRYDVEVRHNLAWPVKTRNKYLVQDHVPRKKDNTGICFYEKFEHVFFEPCLTIFESPFNEINLI
jgi:hypothetical protein